MVNHLQITCTEPDIFFIKQKYDIFKFQIEMKTETLGMCLNVILVM